MKSTSCLLCHEGEIWADHRMRALHDDGGAIDLPVCKACHNYLCQSDWLGLMEYLVETKQPRIGQKKLGRTYELIAEQFDLVKEIRGRLLDGYLLRLWR